MAKTLLLGVSLLAFASSTLAGEPTSRNVRAQRDTSDCETRMQKLDASNAEGEERLAEKNDVIEFCATQYTRDKTIQALVSECAKYEEQPVVKQQAVAECQLAAFSYANALRSLRAEYGK